MVLPAKMKRPSAAMKPLHVRSRSPDERIGPTAMPPSPTVNNRHPLCVFVPVAALLFLILLVYTKEPALPASSSTHHHSYAAPGSSSLIEQIHDTSAMSEADEPVKAIREGVLNVHVSTQDGVGYYHCAATAPATQPVHSLVLLHGAAFSKEDWRRAGILDQLCAAAPALQVTALDLSVRATAADLRAVLQALAADGLVARLPCTALVTPSASGGAVAEWIAATAAASDGKGGAVTLPDYIETWVPVASNAVQSVDAAALEALRDRRWPILAIYGNLDTPGMRSMQRLGDHAGATVTELKGTHPVYLDSPTPFVLTILDYLNVEL